MFGLLSGLASALYELPKKVIAYETLQQLNIDPSNCDGIGRARVLLDGGIEQLNRATAGLDDNGMRGYAVGGMDKVETFLHVKEYVANCDPFHQAPQLTDTAQKVVNYAIEYAHQHGKEIPFTGHPLLDTLIVVGGAVATGLGAKYFLGKRGGDLFPDYSK